MVEVGACEAEGPFPFHSEKAPLPEFTPALRACRITDDPEDDNVAGISTAPTVALWPCICCRFHVRSADDCPLTLRISGAAQPRPLHALVQVSRFAAGSIFHQSSSPSSQVSRPRV